MALGGDAGRSLTTSMLVGWGDELLAITSFPERACETSDGEMATAVKGTPPPLCAQKISLTRQRLVDKIPKQAGLAEPLLKELSGARPQGPRCFGTHLTLLTQTGLPNRGSLAGFEKWQKSSTLLSGEKVLRSTDQSQPCQCWLNIVASLPPVGSQELRSA